MNSNNFLLSRNFHITEIMCNLDFWLLSAFLNQVFYLFICFLIAFRSDLISGLIENIVMFVSSQRCMANNSNTSKLVPTGSFSLFKQIWRTGRSHSGISASGDGEQVHSTLLEKKGYTKLLHGCIKKKSIGNILVVLKIRHTKNATVQDPRLVQRLLAQFLKPFISSQMFLCIS